MKALKIAAALAALLTATPASAFSWQQFWTGSPTPEDSGLNQYCGTLKVGFLKAAPCLSERLRVLSYVEQYPAVMQFMLDFADRIDALAAQVNSATMTEQQAYATYEARRLLVGQIKRVHQNREQLQDLTDNLQRSFEVDRINQCIAHPRYGC